MSLFVRLSRHATERTLRNKNNIKLLSTLEEFLESRNKPSNKWYYDNPSRLVDGVSSEQLDRDPELAAYFAANFPDPFPTVQEVQKEKVEKVREAKSKDDDPLARLNIRRLVCFPRDHEYEEGSRKCRRLRVKHKIIPGIIYGGDKNLGIDKHNRNNVWVKTPLSEIQRERDRYHHDFECRVYELTVVDQASRDEVLSTHRVVPQNVQMHPWLNKPYCVNYLRYYPGRVLKIPIRTINEDESPGLKRDGFVVPIHRHLECIVEDGVPIPEAIDCDCTGARIKDKLRIDRLIIPDGVKINKNVNQTDFLVGPIFGRRGKDSMGGLDDEESEDDSVDE